MEVNEANSGSERGRLLVKAWNAGDVDYLIDQLADDVVLEARLPKIPVPAPSVSVTGKQIVADRLTALSGPLPKFAIVNAMERDGIVSLVLEDEDRQLLVVGIKLDDEGRFSRITSFRPDR